MILCHEWTILFAYSSSKFSESLGSKKKILIVIHLPSFKNNDSAITITLDSALGRIQIVHFLVYTIDVSRRAVNFLWIMKADN